VLKLFENSTFYRFNLNSIFMRISKSESPVPIYFSIRYFVLYIYHFYFYTNSSIFSYLVAKQLRRQNQQLHQLKLKLRQRKNQLKKKTLTYSDLKTRKMKSRRKSVNSAWLTTPRRSRRNLVQSPNLL
jgi:hypothetical protein